MTKIESTMMIKVVNENYITVQPMLPEFLEEFRASLKCTICRPPMSSLSLDIFALDMYKNIVIGQVSKLDVTIPPHGSLLVDIQFGKVSDSIVVFTDNEFAKDEWTLG